jgi:SpoVK/Ycf46/Vps4 family AAA+-type ATPase
MPSLGRFLELLDAVSRRDWQSIEHIGKAAAEDERKKRHFQAAHRISEAIEIAVSHGALSDLVGTVSSPSMPLTSIPADLLVEADLKDIVEPLLPRKHQLQIAELIGEWKLESQLRLKGVSPRHTVLLHGPPGCGKTHLAKYIARSLEMRLFIVRFDTLISSFLGETGSNLRKIFEFISHNRCALFIDEIDAIAKMRDDRNELGELKRVVISLLQNIDIAESKSLILAATNHPHMLDTALWRRFELVLELDTPLDQERILLFEKRLSVKLADDVRRLLAESTTDFTGSDIIQICLSARRKGLIKGVDNSLRYLFESILEHLRRTSLLDDKKKKIDDRRVMAALSLKKLFSDDFSFQDLEALSGVSHSTLHSRFANLRGNDAAQ